MISNVLMPGASGKGGVGKTTLVSNLIALAGQEWRVLAVDCDQSGNLVRRFDRRGTYDQGANLAQAIMGGGPLVPVRGVRPGVDFVPGGRALEELDRYLTTRPQTLPGYQPELEAVLAPLAGDYDLVVLDLPPYSAAIHDACYTAARALVVPTKSDPDSVDGLDAVFRKYVRVLQGPNPDLAVLGVALMDFEPRSSRVNGTSLAEIESKLHGRYELIQPPVRHAYAAVQNMSRMGVLAHEYEALKQASVKRRVESLRATGTTTEAYFAANADSYAAEMFAVCHRILEKFVALNSGVDLRESAGAAQYMEVTP